MGISTKSSLINKTIAAIRSGEYSSQAEITRKYRVDKSFISKYIKGKMQSKTTYFSKSK
jgi:predicted transcriptional regulator